MSSVPKTLSAVRAAAASKSQQLKSAWHEHAIRLAADYLAANHVEHPDKYKNGTLSYEAFKEKGRMHQEVAELTLMVLGDQRIPGETLEGVTETSIRKLLYRSRPLLNLMIAECSQSLTALKLGVPDGVQSAPASQPGPLLKIKITRLGSKQVSTGVHIAGKGDLMASEGDEMITDTVTALALVAKGFASLS